MASEVKNELRTRCEIWTRVMGYHRPVSHFNLGKKSEHYSRKHFKETAEDNSAFNERYGVAKGVESGQTEA